MSILQHMSMSEHRARKMCVSTNRLWLCLQDALKDALLEKSELQRCMGVEGLHPSDVLDQHVVVLIRAACIEPSGDLCIGIISAQSRRKDAGFPLIF
ncbi:uncharacterized protein [Zea mays]|uniref:Uncharacterized protein n=1 Tax=Zea mays TaxID=4577 RepID=B6SLT1_MAIZE|nr:uncharacterized protein LOC100275099 isoform X3 [Zea mays]ACG25814.1 hypothetical protein [Zea mays]|eukprot:XP_008650027.1 uncharacterized protein LOC109939180 isoform X3 [Zea mays]